MGKALVNFMSRKDVNAFLCGGNLVVCVHNLADGKPISAVLGGLAFALSAFAWRVGEQP